MTLTDTLVPRKPPLREDADGTIRIGQTRVTLDTVIGAYWEGMSAEEIASAYSSLDLADVHAVLGYYLSNRAAVDQHLSEHRSSADMVRHQVQQRSPWKQLRERMLARHNSTATNS